jgi:hypothetical protein
MQQRRSPDKSITPREEPKLVILRAVYGVGPQADIDVTETLRNRCRDGLVIPVDNNLVPRDPMIGIQKRLVVDYSYGDGIVYSAYRLESTAGNIVRLVLPEDSEVLKLQKEVSHLQAKCASEKANDLSEKAKAENRVILLEAKLSDLTGRPKPSPTLRERTIAACDDLNRFLSEYGPTPGSLPRGIEESDDVYNVRKMTALLGWKAKMGADFRLRFVESIGRLRDEIQVRCGIHEPELDTDILKAGSQLCEPRLVEAIHGNLWMLASKMNN